MKILMILPLLVLIFIANEVGADQSCEPYARSMYRHWTDADGDGINTRHEILARDSIVPVGWHNKRVVSGYWIDPYTGFHSANPQDFDIEHGYALRDTHYAGACHLSKEDKQKLANDERQLFVAWKGSNRAKGAKNLIEWLPSDLSFIGRYANMRRLIISEYDLKPPECEVIALDYFEGYGRHFRRGIDIRRIRSWVLDHLHVFQHRCFHNG